MYAEGRIYHAGGGVLHRSLQKLLVGEDSVNFKAGGFRRIAVLTGFESYSVSYFLTTRQTKQKKEPTREG